MVCLGLTTPWNISPFDVYIVSDFSQSVNTFFCFSLFFLESHRLATSLLVGSAEGSVALCGSANLFGPLCTVSDTLAVAVEGSSDALGVGSSCHFSNLLFSFLCLYYSTVSAICQYLFYVFLCFSVKGISNNE